VATALLVIVPEAEHVVGVHRAALDRAAGRGVPAHVTVLFPFAEPSAATDSVLAPLVATVPAFRVRFAEVRWFGDAVVWLAPDPPSPFQELTRRVAARFPDHPPYGGEHEGTIPHLTIGHDHPPAVLRAAGAAVLAHGPIHARVTSMRLITGPAGRGPWSTVAEFPFG